MLDMMTASEEITKLVLTKAQTEERRRLTEWLEDRIKASKRAPSAEVVTLVPALAQLLLERNPTNRPISQRNADHLGADIASGRWQFNGESVIVSNTGILLDGQHRCMEAVATNTPIQTVIVFGPKEEARFSIDIGRPKTVSNFLAMKGRKYTSYLATVANYHLQWRVHGYLLYGGCTAQYPTKAQILAAADDLKGLDTSVEFVMPSTKTVRSTAVLAFCHYVFWKKSSREASDYFIDKLIVGDKLPKGDPMLYCRNRLLNCGAEIRAGTRAELIFKCWNAHRLGLSIDHFKVSGGKLPRVES